MMPTKERLDVSVPMQRVINDQLREVVRERPYGSTRDVTWFASKAMGRPVRWIDDGRVSGWNGAGRSMECRIAGRRPLALFMPSPGCCSARSRLSWTSDD